MAAWVLLFLTSLLTFSAETLCGESFHATEEHNSKVDTRVGKRSWRADLRPHGYKKRVKWQRSKYTDPYGGNVAFSGDDTLIVRFRNWYDGERELDLWVVALDAHTSEILGSRKWPVRHLEYAVQATREGRFVVQLGDQLILYSRTFEELKRYTLPKWPGARLDWWDVRTTFSRASIVVRHHADGSSIKQVLWLDSDSLELRHTWKVSREPNLTRRSESLADRLNRMNIPGNATYSDTQVITTLTDRERKAFRLLARELDGPWRQLRPPAHTDRHEEIVHFINDETLFFSRRHELRVVGTDGTVVLNESLRKKETVWSGKYSVNGQRIAFPIGEYRGGVPRLDISSHAVLKRIVIYDIPSRRWVAKLDKKVGGLKYLAGYALSPDGTRMAVLRDRYVEVYPIPDGESLPAQN